MQRMDKTKPVKLKGIRYGETKGNLSAIQFVYTQNFESPVFYASRSSSKVSKEIEIYQTLDISAVEISLWEREEESTDDNGHTTRRWVLESSIAGLKLFYKQGGRIGFETGQQTAQLRMRRFYYKLPLGCEIIGLKCSDTWGLTDLSLLTWSVPLRFVHGSEHFDIINERRRHEKTYDREMFKSSIYASVILVPHLSICIGRVLQILLFQGDSKTTYILPLVVELLLYNFSIEANSTLSQVVAICIINILLFWFDYELLITPLTLLNEYFAFLLLVALPVFCQF